MTYKLYQTEQSDPLRSLTLFPLCIPKINHNVNEKLD